jgi:LacI family transcriptional regulator
MSSTIAELAARLNLSKGAVSRILNHKGEAFSEETRRRVFALADEVGYRPHPVARALATGRTGFIGLWVADLLTSYHAHVAHQMEDHLERHGYQVFITLYGKAGWDPDNRTPAAMPVVADGIIAHEVPPFMWPRLFGNLPGRLPIVTTGAWHANEAVDYVGIDLGPASVEAVRHLVLSGRRRIAYMTDHLPIPGSDVRYESYNGVLGESGVPVEYIETGKDRRAVVRAAARAYFEANGCPEAIFCHNDDTAIAAYRAVCDVGMRVPDDVALIGCDGIEDAEYLPTPISTIVQPLGEMCETAARFLERRLNDRDAPPQRVILQPTFVPRASSPA